MSRTTAQRTLDAEVRAVSEGHKARLSGDGKTFSVKSDTTDATYQVGVKVVADVVVFTCSCPYGQHGPTSIPCKHGALAARRLERENLLRWEAGGWVPTVKALRAKPVYEQPADPFEGLPT